MELDELQNLNQLNELDLLYKIIDFANANKGDVERVLKGEKSAGIRVRHKMQDIKLLCEIIRDKIQLRKGLEWGEKRVFALDKAIKDCIEKEEKEKEYIRKRKQERIIKAREFRK
jgi:hypothetical protein